MAARTNPDTDLAAYYARRADEYEKIFEKPERQEDLASLRGLLPRLLAGHRVLEVACGTGYWTQVISESVAAILATDINEATLEIARRKSWPKRNVTFQIADALSLSGVSGAFTAGFAGFWWSHVPKQRLPAFLATFHGKLRPGADVVFLDNNFVAGSSTPLARRDEAGNTYQRRKLAGGGEFEVLKNFPDESELRQIVRESAANVTVTGLKYYWCLSYKLRSP